MFILCRSCLENAGHYATGPAWKAYCELNCDIEQTEWLVFTTMDNGTTPNSTAMLPQILNRHRNIGLSKVPQSETNNLGPGRNGSDTELIAAPGWLIAVKPAKNSGGPEDQQVVGCCRTEELP